MAALDLIISWAQSDLYEWQQDAARRLLTQETLSAEDENDIFRMLKERKGIIDSKNPAKKPLPIKKGDVSGAPSQKVTIILKSINNLRNVNAIPDGSGLPFGHEGLNVIYGDNASGKSGYARVLKKACKARDIEEKLLPNVFNPSKSGPAAASFKVSINNEPDKDVPWQDGKREDEGLFSNICVFDSKCARFIVDKNNETTYIPYGTGIFPDLVDLMKTIRSKIDYEKPKPERLEYSDIPSTTIVGKLISEVTHETSASLIEENTAWHEEDERKFTQLKKQVSELESNDPAKVALKLRNTKDRINRLIQDITLIDEALSTVKEEGIKQLIINLNITEKAHTLALKQPSPPEPLEGVGEKAWQVLYNAAKEYSTTLAYPGKEFPVIEDDSLCVLCMQSLQSDAKERMLRFKAFMEKATKKDMEKAQKNVDEAIEEIKNIRFPQGESYKDIKDEFRDKYPEAIKQLEEYLPEMKERSQQLIMALLEKTIEPSTPIRSAKPSPKEAMLAISEQLETEAKDVEKAANPEELVKKKMTLKNSKLEKCSFKKR